MYSGDKAISIEIDNQIDEKTISAIRGMMRAIEERAIEGIQEMIPAYKSLLVLYDPLLIGPDDLIGILKGIEESLNTVKLPPAEIVHIPTLYGGDTGVDLEHVAVFNNMSCEEVILEHSSTDYLVYMLGFTPGFPYLGGMSKKIETPRRENPRIKVPKGSVGIAGSQTGIYSIESPGGWQIIGRTPLDLFDMENQKPVLLKAGQYIRFEPIDLETFERISLEIQSKTYEVMVTKREA